MYTRRSRKHAASLHTSIGTVVLSRVIYRCIREFNFFFIKTTVSSGMLGYNFMQGRGFSPYSCVQDAPVVTLLSVGFKAAAA
jgi:hypothetical protein